MGNRVQGTGETTLVSKPWFRISSTCCFTKIPEIESIIEGYICETTNIFIGYILDTVLLRFD
jgi:hypothetical protein